MKTIKIVRNIDDPNKMGTVVVQDKDQATNIGFSKDSDIPEGEYKLAFEYDPVLKRRLWTVKGSAISFFPKVEYTEDLYGFVLFAHPYLKGENGALVVSKCKGDPITELNSILRQDKEAKLTITDFTKNKKKEKKEKAKPEVKEEEDPGPKVKNDDLTEVEGLGKVAEKLLNENGINHFKELGRTDEEVLIQILSAHSKRMGQTDVSNWPKEAKKLSKVKK